jgi:hypothetical protein
MMDDAAGNSADTPNNRATSDFGKPDAPLSQITDVLERRIAPALERIATALERRPVRAAADPVTEAVTRIREAVQAGRWNVAQLELESAGLQFPDHPELESHRATINRGRECAIEGLHARIVAAREVNDPGHVLELRDEIYPLLATDAQGALDCEMIGWLMQALQRRLRSGTIGLDVVELAAKIVDRFAHHKEGASLRAALPTLRRSAGLCGQCGQPYRGIANACPRCTGLPDPEINEDFLKSPPALT